MSANILEQVTDIPKLNYQILISSHPYYTNKLCLLNNNTKLRCEQNRYGYIQRSTNELISMFPNISFSDVVMLATVYNPIPESLIYYDRYTLFYNACKRGLDNPEYFLKDGNGIIIDFRDTSAILWICLRFERLDILHQLLDRFKDNKVRNGKIKAMINLASYMGGEDIVYGGSLRYEDYNKILCIII